MSRRSNRLCKLKIHSWNDIKSSYPFPANYHCLPRGIPAHECQKPASDSPARKYSLCFVKTTVQRCLHLKKTQDKTKTKAPVIFKREHLTNVFGFEEFITPNIFHLWQNIRSCLEIIAACSKLKSYPANKLHVRERENQTQRYCCTSEMPLKTITF